VLPRVETVNDGVEDTGGAIHDVQRRMKSLLDNFSRGDVYLISPLVFHYRV